MINMSFLDPQSAVLWTRCYELPFTWKATHPFTLPLSIGPGPIILHEEDGSPLVGRLRPLVNLERWCEQVRKILPCRCSNLRQPSWRHGTLVCLKAHNMTFGFNTISRQLKNLDESNNLWSPLCQGRWYPHRTPWWTFWRELISWMTNKKEDEPV